MYNVHFESHSTYFLAWIIAVEHNTGIQRSRDVDIVKRANNFPGIFTET